MAECNLEVLAGLTGRALELSGRTDRGVFHPGKIDGPDGEAYVLAFPVSLRDRSRLTRPEAVRPPPSEYLIPPP